METHKRQKLILLDAGHGGLVEGNYTTSGKRSPEWGDGQQLYEGVFNRTVAHMLAWRLSAKDIRVHLVAPENDDISLSSRVERINALAKKYTCFGLSIHANAANSRRARGWEVFVKEGDQESGTYAEEFADQFELLFPVSKIRRSTPSKKYKEYNFYVLAKSQCPFVLLENFFMTNEYECKQILMHYSGLCRISEYMARAVEKIYDRL